MVDGSQMKMNDAEPNLVLIGLRACGKSTIGRMVGDALGWGFVDLDDVSAGVLGCSGAGEAIERFGIERFREAEGEALRRVLGGEGRGKVIALGGGTPTALGCDVMLREAQREGRARVFYLKATVETLVERLGGSDNRDRPSLTGKGVLEEVGEVFAARDPLYMELAETVVHVDGVGEESVCAAVVAMVRGGV